MLTYLMLQKIVIDLFIVPVVVSFEDSYATLLHVLQEISKHNTLRSSLCYRILLRKLLNESSECHVSRMSLQSPPPTADDVLVRANARM